MSEAPERIVVPYEGKDVTFVLASKADEWKRQRDRLLEAAKGVHACSKWWEFKELDEAIVACEESPDA